MKHNLLTKILVLVLALLVLIPNTGLGVFAADDGDPTSDSGDTPSESFDVSGSKTASPKLLIGDERETTVTLSLPSAEYQNDVYILFTADTSSSISNNNIDFGEMVSEMFSDILEMNPNLEINVGVLKFTGKVSDGIDIASGGEYKGFVQYSDDVAEFVDLAIDAPSTRDWDRSRDPSRPEYGKWPEYEREQSIPGRGSNLAGALDISEEWLDALVEEGVEKNKIYLVVLTDGKSYIWNNEDNEPVTYYTQYYNHYAMSGSGVPTLGQQTGARDKESYPVQVAGTEAFLYGFAKKTGATLEERSNPDLYQSLFDLSSDNAYFAEINDTDGKYDEPCFYVETGVATLPGENATVYSSTNGSTLKFTNPNNNTTNNSFTGGYLNYYDFTPDGDYDFLPANPYNVVKNEDGSIKVDENGKVTFDTESINEDFYMLRPDSLQKSLYLSGHLWTDLSEKYNCGAVVFRNRLTADGPGWALDGGLGPAASFDSWILENSQYAADILNTDQVTAMFSDINNDMLYMVSKGTVTDIIKDSFDLSIPEDGNPFTVTLSGEALNVTKGEENTWYFGELDPETELYPYVVEYDESNKTITWTINVPIENANPITLSYNLLLTDESAETSDIYDTNESAVLDYISTDGKKDGSFTFEVPKVAYIKLIDIDVEKVWSDNNNQDGKRSTEITVELVEVFDDEEEEVVDEVVLNEKSWKYTFEGLYDATAVFDENDEPVEIVPITYSVKEVTVKDYTSVLSGSAEEGFVITNTHTPETIDIKIEKVWYDEDPSLRPASIKVDLLADGDPVESVELSEKTGWKAVFEGMPKYSNGQEIIYEVSESGIDVKTYWPLVSPSEDGFTITNTQIFDLKIKKVWDDEDDKDGVRPEEIYVTVLGNGEPFIEEIPIGEYCEWEITLYGMPVFFDGEKVEYSVIEEEVEDYEEPEIIFEPDYGFIIKNTHKVEEPPKTDDATNQWFWAGMMVSSMALIAVIFYLKRRQDEE